MALPSSGTISLGQVNTELGRSSTNMVSLGESAVRNLAGRSSGAISLGNLHGKSSFTWTTELSYSPATKFTYAKQCVGLSSSGCSVTTTISLSIKADGAFTITSYPNKRVYNGQDSPSLYVKLVSKTAAISTNIGTSWVRISSEALFSVTASRSGLSNGTKTVNGTANIQLSTSSNGANPVNRQFTLEAQAKTIDGYN